MSIDRLAPRAHRVPTPLSESLPALERLALGGGIVTREIEVEPGPGDARLVDIRCELADPAPKYGRTTLRVSGGVHVDRDAARAAALGEAIERWSLAYVPEQDLIAASARELGALAVDPAKFALFDADEYAREGFRWRPFTPDTPVRWAPAVELASGAGALVPAQLVYRFRDLAPGETPIAYATSNGLACGPTPEEALLGGLLEVVERDAVMIAWLARLSLPRVDRQADTWLTDVEHERFDPAGGGHELVDLSAFSGVPVALATVGGGDVHFALGSAAAPTMREACWKALREAYQSRTTVRALLADVARAGFARGRTEATAVAYEHGTRFASAAQSARAAFLTAAASTRPIGACPSIEETDVGVRLRTVAARLAARGVDAYAVDLTPPEVRAGGFTVVRVLSPQAVAPAIEPGERFLGGERLYEAPRRAGLAERRLEPADLNPDPHPYV